MRSEYPLPLMKFNVDRPDYDSAADTQISASLCSIRLLFGNVVSSGMRGLLCTVTYKRWEMDRFQEIYPVRTEENNGLLSLASAFVSAAEINCSVCASASHLSFIHHSQFVGKFTNY
jgi:hypothetical protein